MLLELVGGLGSDTFDVGGGNNGTPITVVSNNLEGHSGLIAQLVQSADLTYNNLSAQWVSANVSDNDAPGVVISQQSPLLVFENQNAPTGMAQTRYSIVLAEAPTEDVRITASPTPPPEAVTRAGGLNVQLNGSDNGVTLLFTRANWFIPQYVTVTAQADGVAEGQRFVTIQHTVVQGSSPSDGGVYDGLPVAGVSVEVVDADTASLVAVPYDTGSQQPENNLLVAENPSGSLPATDAYAVVLSKQPTGEVDYAVTSDGMTQIQVCNATLSICSPYSTSAVVTFTSSTYNAMQIVRIRAVNDNIAQGLHFSRLSDGITSNAAAYLGLTGNDVADGLAAAVNGDTTGRFQASVSGTTLTITGPAFTTTPVTAGEGTVTTDNGASVHAYVGPLTLNLTGTITTGDVWTVTLNGAGFGYGAQQGDTLPIIATKLADTITKGGLFHATATGASITITPPDSSPFTAALSIVRTVNGQQVSGTGTIAPASGGFSLSSTAYSKLVLHINVSTPIQLGDAWVLSLNTGTSSASAVSYSYVAGQYGESVLLPPIDVQIADDEAPGVLVIQPTGSTNVIEPSSFVVLGDGFVRQVLSTCGTGVTCFQGDFGTSEMNEINFHATLATSQDLDLGAWGLNANPDIANATTIPHITVHGTGDGNSDYYKFNVTSDMLANSGGAVTTTFDMDNGFAFGDPIVWLSHLQLYNSSGDLIAQGPGYSNPLTAGAGGSSTWYDDFLSTTLTSPGEYYLQVGSWLLTTGLPVGVTYDLQASVEQHAVAGFVFAPSPVQENESGNNTTPQNIDDSSNWYTFFNQLIGDGAFGGSISSGTPYAQIQGSGDGSFDLYSFTVTPDMLTPTGSTISPTSQAAAGPFYTSVGLKLNGTVSAGDTWSLGVGNRATISYVAQPGDGLLQVAQHLASQLSSPYSTCVANAGTSSCSGYSTDSVLLVISNSAGFSLNGATLNGITQQTQGANTVTRSTSVNQASGSAESLTAATISLDGSPTPGDVWTLTVGGFGAQHIFGSSDSGHAMAVDLAGQINTHFGTTILTADATLAKLTLSSASGTTVALSIRGGAPTGSMTVSGAVPVAGQVGATPWTSETISIANGNVRTGETWHTTLTDLGPVQATVVTGGSASALATLLSTAISGHNGYTTSIDTTVTGFAKLTINRSTPFTLTPVSIDHAGTMTVSNGTFDTHVVTIDAVSGETGTWTLTISPAGGGSPIATATSSNGPGSIASDLASQLDGTDFEVTAAATGDVLTITRIDAAATDFDVARHVRAGLVDLGRLDHRQRRDRPDAGERRHLHAHRRVVEQPDPGIRRDRGRRRDRARHLGERARRLHRARLGRDDHDRLALERRVRRLALEDERNDRDAADRGG